MFPTLATVAFLASAILTFVHLVISVLYLLTLCLSRADPNPTAPGPGAVFNEGSPCTISWDADSSGTWKTMNIQLMTGDNFNMIPLTSTPLLSPLYEDLG